MLGISFKLSNFSIFGHSEEGLGVGPFPVIEATESSYNGTSSTSHIVDLPENIQPDDLLIIVARNGGSSTTINTPEDWQFLNSRSSTGRTTIFWKIADGLEGASVTISTSNSRKTAHCSLRISGYQGTPEMAFAETNVADPPELTPSWGSGNTLWIAFTTENGDGPCVEPEHYGELVSSPSTDSSAAGAFVAVASRQLEAVSDDPATFTYSSSSPHAGLIAIQGA